MSEILLRLVRPLRFRGKGRLLRLVVPRVGERPSTVFNTTFLLDLEDHIQWHIYCGLFERQETRLVANYLSPGMTVVDVGANVGYYTALAASCVGPTGRVLAVEPSPYANARLRRMIADNHLHNCITSELGVSDVSGPANLYLEANSHNHSPTLLESPGYQTFAIRTTTLDVLAATHKITRIDLLKLDIEGAEPKVLAGASQLLGSRRIGAILCEFNSHWLRRAGSSVEELYHTLMDADFVEIEPPTRGSQLDTRMFVLRSARRGDPNDGATL